MDTDMPPLAENDHHLEWVPQIYCASNDKIFMEDLLQSDYTFANDFDYKHCTQVLSTLAKMHAYGFKAKTHYYQELYNELKFYGLELQTIFDKYTFHYLCKEYSLYSKIIALPFQIISNFEHFSEDYLSEYIKSNSKHFNQIIEEINENLKEDKITREISYKLIYETLQHNEYKLINFNLNEIPNIKGYLGQQKLLTIKIQLENQLKTLSYFVKLLPEEKGQHDVLLKMNGFEREVIVFLEIFKLMQESGIQIHEVVPKCYLGLINDCLIFEYLENYKSCNKFQMYDFDHVNLMFKSLAKLHAFSVIVEEKLNICLGDKFSTIFKEFMYNEDGINAGFKGVQFMNNCLKYLDVEFLIKKLNIMKQKFPDYVKRSKTYRNVLSHGDLWLNNAMFSYDVNGKPIHCYIIDFQYCRYLPQAHDVMCSLHLTTSNDLRKQYQEQLLLNYYKYFKDELLKYDIDCEKIICVNDFLQSCQELEPFAMFQKTFYFQFSMMCSEYEDNYRSNLQLQEQFLNGDRYHVIHENWKMSEMYRKYMAECHVPVLEYCKQL
ncbi:uncharacterized protein LOC123292083 [Chrysoperla carnea]|uniref:uncharacterized protein LOC123292083 n=1 Tax=Chrysoperla carnea TaxID=189513 RepID=UPI001D0977AF|nr:uncharacterized protein LOC123292083 [Chrysoperla carnea]